MSLDAARPLLFLRAFARIATNHNEVLQKHATRVSTARMLGEFVSLLALVYLAEHNGSRRPYQIMLGIFFAFLLPTLILKEEVLRKARTMLVGSDEGVGSHVLVGTLGVFLCYAVYEGLIKLADDWRIAQDGSD